MFKDIKMKDVFTAYVCYEINHNKDLKKEVKEMIKDVTGEFNGKKNWLCLHRGD
jgi:ABC-type uncharacterized transport system substrate-binding protein